jgi:hypothetical protein
MVMQGLRLFYLKEEEVVVHEQEQEQQEVEEALSSEM